MNVRWMERQAKKRAQRARPFSEEAAVAKAVREAKVRLTEAKTEAKIRACVRGLPLELRCEILKHVEWTTVELFKMDRGREAVAKFRAERPIKITFFADFSGLLSLPRRHQFLFEIWTNGGVGVFCNGGGWCKFGNFEKGGQDTGPPRPMCWKAMIALLSPNSTYVTVNSQWYNCTPANFEAKVTEALERITRFT